MQSSTVKKERARLRRLSQSHSRDELRLHPGFQTHDNLWKVAKQLPKDYVPYGQMVRETLLDCSSGCRWYHGLAGTAGMDWGVCANVVSHRSGLLTYEHQGCPQLESDPRSEYLESPSGRKARQIFEGHEAELRRWGKVKAVLHD